MRRTSRALVGAALSLASAIAPSPAAADAANTITANVSTFRSAKGFLVCRLFAAPTDFPAKGYKTLQTVTVTGKTAMCVFPDVAAGTYAVAVFHDENGNGKLDTNFLGLPNEGVGTSNNKRPLIGPPTWDGSKFTVQGDVTVSIVLRY